MSVAGSARPAGRTPATEVRAALIAAARRLVEREGAAALTVRAVAAEAGVAPMGVYNHFDGKPGLLDAVVTDGFAEFRDAIDSDDADPAGRLAASGHNYRLFAVSNPGVYALMFSSECHAEDEVAAAAFSTLVDIIRYGQAAGIVRQGDSTAIAAQTWAAVHGAVSLELGGTYPPYLDADQVYGEVLSLILRGIAPGESSG